MKNIVETESERWALFERFKQCLFQEAVREIDARRHIPDILNELVLTAPLDGLLFGSEPRHIPAAKYQAKIENEAVHWRITDLSEWHSFSLKLYFDEGEWTDTVHAAFNKSDFHSRSAWMRRLAWKILDNHPEIIPEGEPDILITRKELAGITGEFYSKLPITDDFINFLYIAIASICPLNSRNYGAIACALHHHHPTVGLLHLPNDVLKQMILDLPNFKGAGKDIDERLLGAAITLWIDIRDGGLDDQWDAYL